MIMPPQLVSLSYDCCFHAFVSDRVLLRTGKHNGFIREANVEFCELPVFLSLVLISLGFRVCCTSIIPPFLQTCRSLSEIVNEPSLHRYGLIVYFHPNCILPVLFQCHLHGRFPQLLLPC